MDYWFLLPVTIIILYIAVSSLFHQMVDKKASVKNNRFIESLTKEKNLLDAKEKALNEQELHISTLISNLENSLRTDYKKLENELRQKYAEAAFSDCVASGISDHFPRYFTMEGIRYADPDLQTRLISAANDNLSISGQINCSCIVVGSTGNKYQTSFSSCTCEDYKRRHAPCKHMLFLSLALGCSAHQDNSDAFSYLRDLKETTSSLERVKREAETVCKKSSALKQDVVRLINEKKQTYPWLAKQISDLYTKYDDKLAQELLEKRHPARQAAKNVQEISKDYKTALEKQKQLEYQISVYEAAFPFLEEFKELTPDQALSSFDLVCDEKRDYDHSRDWLSKDEYDSLSSAERDQLALNRYCSRNMTNWEAGIEYEQYIGYLCEVQNYHVSYTGATKGVEDFGQDLVLTQGTKKIVIQCKRWSSDKTIHEKHIFQLYGSVVTTRILQPDYSVSGVFVTTATLSSLANECANLLGIKVVENFPLSDYPRIKCNISKSGDRIYHLPFDQQYNRIVIDAEKGEFFAHSVSDALSAGFRRALKWHS